MGWGLAEWIKCVLYEHEGPGLKPENPCKLRIVVCASVPQNCYREMGGRDKREGQLALCVQLQATETLFQTR